MRDQRNACLVEKRHRVMALEEGNGLVPELRVGTSGGATRRAAALRCANANAACMTRMISAACLARRT